MFWPFPILRNHPTSFLVDNLFTRFIEADDVILEKYTEYEIVLSSPLNGTLSFWNANKYYAWAQSGRFTDLAGKGFSWGCEMPSRWSVVLMREKLTNLMRNEET